MSGGRPGDGSEARRAGRTSVVEVPDGTVSVRIRGRGPPLLCLHGLSAHGVVWRAVAARLADAFSVHVPDLLGRGASGARPELSYRLGPETARVAALVSGFADRGYLVAGHSQGAALAVALAAAAERGPGPGPPRPAGLVLLNPVTPWTRRPRVLAALRIPIVRRVVARALRPARRPITRWVLERRAFGDASRVDEAAVRRYARPWSDPASATTLLRVLADWRPAELSAHLPEAPPPTRTVAGELDHRIATAETRRWARRLGAGFEVASGAGHMVPEERPELAAAATRRVAERAGLGT